ncbi:MAG: hypothetical protein IPO92_11965 [Saprospiraceae bacterium]|nr:hypothetical protein [Saprospiraceae bacterium]
MDKSSLLHIHNTSQRHCRLCKQPFKGRADKIFCSATCKAQYHIKRNKVTHTASERIDKILHRNRSILLELMGKEGKQNNLDKKILDAKKFNWTYITHYHINSQNKTVHYIYDFSWMIFSDQEVLIKRIST